MEKVIIFGGTGFIGLSLANHLARNGFKPILVARNQPKKTIDFVQWDSFSLGFRRMGTNTRWSKSNCKLS